MGQEKKEAEAQAKKKQMEEDERKRQEMLAAQKEGGKKSSGPAMDARKEMSKSKEQVEEEMKISLSIRIKPLALGEMDSDERPASPTRSGAPSSPWRLTSMTTS